MRSVWLVVGLVCVAMAAEGATLPGFRVERIGRVVGFPSSIAVDSGGRIYYTTTAGGIYRVENGESFEVGRVTTEAIGNAGLLGMALVDDATAVVHYTAGDQAYEVIAKVDLRTGKETAIANLACDPTFPGRGTSPEHHGGNPSVGADGSIVVGIGDFGGFNIAEEPEWVAGKVIRITPDGQVEQLARGFRNPFDLVWDASKQRAIVPDNGELIDDEVNIVRAGDDCGWPRTSGHRPPIEGTLAPVYVFPETVAPTGITALNDADPILHGGYLVGSYVTKAIYWFPDIDASPLPAPLTLIAGETAPVIDVAQAPSGTIYFVTGAFDASGSWIYRLVPPQRGDCNGDGLVDRGDLAALEQELGDGNPERALEAPNGAFHGSLGCDVNGDGRIDSDDLVALGKLLGLRPRLTRIR